MDKNQEITKEQQKVWDRLKNNGQKPVEQKKRSKFSSNMYNTGYAALVMAGHAKKCGDYKSAREFEKFYQRTIKPR